MEVIFDEYDMRKLPPRERLDKIIQILRNDRYVISFPSVGEVVLSLDEWPWDNSNKS